MRRSLALWLSLGAALVLAASAAAGTGGLAPPDPDSPGAEGIRDLYWLLVVIAGFIFLIVTVPLVLFIVRYRSRGRAREIEGPQVRGNRNLEIGWTLGAVLILVVIAAAVFYKLPGIRKVDEAGAAGDLVVQVEGRQFYWQYRYPNGAVAIDRLRVPQGRVVHTEITAPEGDVNHSFWIPALGGKFDAIPGVTTSLEFRAEETGVYPGQCAEFCGVQHTAMDIEVEVMPPDEFERWVDARRGDLRALGEEEWNGVCTKCHRLGDEDRLIGPSLAAAALADEEALAETVRNGQGEMPAVGRNWTDEQMRALIQHAQRLAEGLGDGG
ncbi:MAG: cytochrome c oxidase subunit II [Actinomycetota bacterium]|nr:cytochrome c oxidase subunit II [Actinomycetota bacterium]